MDMDVDMDMDMEHQADAASPCSIDPFTAVATDQIDHDLDHLDLSLPS